MLESQILLDMNAFARPQVWAWLAIAFAAGILIWLLSPILAPFLFAAILAYILDPVVERMTLRGAPRVVAALLVLLLALGAIVGIALVVGPLFYKETRLLLEKLPAVLDWLDSNAAPWLRAKLDLNLQVDVATGKQFAREALTGNEDLVKRMLQSLGLGGLALFAFIANLLLVPVVLFYLLRDWNRLLDAMDQLVPRRAHDKVRTMAREMDAVLAEWLRGETFVVLIMATYYVGALSLVGLEVALPTGILSGLAVLVPYVGIVVGVVLATAAALIQFGTLSGLLWVWLAIGIGQALEGMLLTPLIVGNRIGLHPVAVIFALLAFGQVFGFVGVLLALPASAALLVGLRHLRSAYVSGSLYGEP